MYMYGFGLIIPFCDVQPKFEVQGFTIFGRVLSHRKVRGAACYYGNDICLLGFWAGRSEGHHWRSARDGN